MKFQLSIILFAAFLIAACSGNDSSSNADVNRNEVLQLDSTIGWQIDTIRNEHNKFLNADTLYKYYDTVHINNQIYFITEGDLKLNLKDFITRLKVDYLDTVPAHKHFFFQKIIIGYDIISNDTIKWKKFPIRFCIDKKSFDSAPGKFDIIRTNVQHAVKDWMDACNVEFVYVSDADNVSDIHPYNLDFRFIYQEHPGSASAVALSFYPNETNDRNVYIYSGYWNAFNDQVGLIRHEFGHILGFRHEQSSMSDAVPLECKVLYAEEAPPHVDITTYDSMSVMHYFCGGAGTQAMSFSGKDSIAFQIVYGKK